VNKKTVILDLQEPQKRVMETQNKTLDTDGKSNICGKY
jgi:hypothetical protein